MVVTVAAPGDSITDPSQTWPEDRQKVTVGTVVIERASPQTTGACRDIKLRSADTAHGRRRF
jgi:catalase